jgi:succinate dehydrogenase flavin-adding protein (antitoxin of CptAB toxin-antitoxin module)
MVSLFWLSGINVTNYLQEKSVARLQWAATRGLELDAVLGHSECGM